MTIDKRFAEKMILFFFLDMCSVMSSTINTFDHKSLNMENQIKSNCSVLLVADCTISSRFAVFVKPVDDLKSFVLEVHIDDNVIWYSPQNDGNDFIRLQNLTEIAVTSKITPLGEEFELR